MTTFLFLLAMLFAVPFAFMVALAAGMGWREAAYRIDQRSQKENVEQKAALFKERDESFTRGVHCGIAWERRRAADDEHEHRRSVA